MPDPPDSAFAQAPLPHEIEVTLLGPGYGECVLLHVGHGAWIVVDSCEDGADQPLPVLAYLQKLGVSPAAVQWVVATHWHDDHVRRIDELFRHCSSARLAVSSALDSEEVLGGLIGIGQPSAIDDKIHVTSGVRAMQNLLPTNLPLGRVHMVGEGQPLDVVLPDDADHYVLLRVLTPTAATTGTALLQIRDLIEQALQGHDVRVRRPTRNDSAVVLWLEVSAQPPNTNLRPDAPPPAGSVSVLLGADLETRAAPNKGWKGVLASPYRRPSQATAVKVAHHGSTNGYHRPAWERMTNEPVAILAPWDLNKGLPQQAGLDLIAEHASKIYSTAPPKDQTKIVAGRRRPTRTRTLGRITLRTRLPDPDQHHTALDWRVHAPPPACQLHPSPAPTADGNPPT